MDSNIAKVFKKASYSPENDLSRSILLAITVKENKSNQIKIWLYSTIGAFSFVGFIVVVKQLISDFAGSGFYDYLALLFVNSKAFLYWKEIILSMTEALPLTNLIFALTLVFVFILSLRFISQSARIRTKLLIA